MIFSEQDTLPNGVTIPRLALGTWFLPNQQAAEAVKTALSIGSVSYTHLDVYKRQRLSQAEREHLAREKAAPAPQNQ